MGILREQGASIKSIGLRSGFDSWTRSFEFFGVIK